jgi:hypothetical protein
MDTFLDKAESTLISMTMSATIRAPEPVAAAHAPALLIPTQAYPLNYVSTEDFDKHSHESPFAMHTK